MSVLKRTLNIVNTLQNECAVYSELAVQLLQYTLIRCVSPRCNPEVHPALEILKP